MKLYHYAPKENSALEEGLLSNSMSPRGLGPYAKRAGSENRDDILDWLDNTFKGRSKSISCLTEPIKWRGNDPILRKNTQNTMLFFLI